MAAESLLPESWQAEQASWANTREKREGCLSSVVTRGTEHRNLWLCPARSSFSLSLVPPCALTHELVFREHVSPMAEVGGTQLSLAGIKPLVIFLDTWRWVFGDIMPL